MVRTSRAQAAAAANGTPTPNIADDSDEEMAEDTTTPQRNGSDDDGDIDQAEVGEDDDQATPVVDSDAASGPATPSYRRSSTTRKRRAGRPARRGSSRRVMKDDQEARDTGSDVGTPKRRGGWRGRGFGGGRWGKARGGPSHVTQVPLDKEGNMANVKDDEVELHKDPEGEEKVDEYGYLKGGREYRVRTFWIEGKGDRLYMLSTEPARCIGFRDSYLFFQKHRQLYKIIVAEEAKKNLIDRNIIPHSYKGRAIGVVTARSVFREFGARIIIGGKKITDDYQVAAARAQGDVEGEYAVPEDNIPHGGDEYDRNRYVAWHGASAVYHSGAPSVPAPNGKAAEGKKRKVVVTGSNWMFEHAREASRFNSSLAAGRRQNLNGVYDVHTNVIQYPKIMQPTHARWEQIDRSAPTARSPQIATEQANGGYLHDEAVVPVNRHNQDNDSVFPNISPIFTRTFMISDTYYETPSTSNLGYPGADGDILDVGPVGLSSVPDHVLAEVPKGCRQAFYMARTEERKWKDGWAGERAGQARANIQVTYNV